MRKELLDAQKSLDRKEVDLKQSETQRQEFKDKLLESQSVIESNNQMIQYLNKQLNESQKPPALQQTGYTPKVMANTINNLAPPMNTINNLAPSLNNPHNNMPLSQVPSQSRP